jgi:hypothetical protein
MNNQYPKCLLFLGPPASGKSKFQKIMIERYKLPSVGVNENIELNFEPYENTIKIKHDNYSNYGNSIYIPPNFEINKIDIGLKSDMKINKEILQKNLLKNFTGDNNHTYLWAIDDLIYKCKSKSSFISINNYIVKKLAQTKKIDLENEEKEFKSMLHFTCQIYIYYICLSIEKTIDDPNFTYVNNSNTNSNFLTRKNYVSRFLQSNKELAVIITNYCQKFNDSNPEIDDISDAIVALNNLDNLIFACNNQKPLDDDSYNLKKQVEIDNTTIKSYIRKVIDSIKSYILSEKSEENKIPTIDKLKQLIKEENPTEYFEDFKLTFDMLKKFLKLDTINRLIRDLKKHSIYRLYYTSYWIARKEKFILFDDTFVSLEDIQDEILIILIKNKINFIWESVGDNLNNSWFYSQIKKLYEYNYRIYSMIPMVETETLRLRMFDRTKASIDINDLTKPRVLFDVVNTDDDFFEKKIKKIYDSFKIIANMVSESSIFDNRLIKPNIQQFNKYNERANKIYFRKNILSCEEGMCLIINPETSIYYPPKKILKQLKSKEEDLDNIHFQFINTLPFKDAYDDVSNISTSADIVKVHFNKLLMKINDMPDSINNFKLNINTVYNFVNKESFRKQWYTEKKNFFFEDRHHTPNIFEMIKNCNIEFSVIRHKLENNVCKSEIPTIYDLLQDDIGSNIDYLNVYADANSYDLMTNLIDGSNITKINQKIEMIKNKDMKISDTQSRIKDDILFIKSLLGSLLLLELINRKIINSREYNKYQNHQMILFRISENQVKLAPESEWAFDDRDQLILKKLDNFNRFSSTSPFIITKNFINYGINDWKEQINQSHVDKFNEYYKLTDEKQKQFIQPQKQTDTCLISVYFVPYKSRVGIKKQIYNINNIIDPERFGQSNETCILPNHELIPIKIFPNDDKNSSKLFKVNIKGFLPEDDAPSLHLEMNANMAQYDFKDNEKDFVDYSVLIPEYLSCLINKILQINLSSIDSIVNFIFDSVFKSGFIKIESDKVLVGPYQINKSIDSNYIETNSKKIKEELQKLFENNSGYKKKYLKYKNKYLQLKKQIFSID